MKPFFKIFILCLFAILVNFGYSQSAPAENSTASSLKIEAANMQRDIAVASRDAAIRQADASSAFTTTLVTCISILTTVFVVSFVAVGIVNIRNSESRIEQQIAEAVTKKVEQQIDEKIESVEKGIDDYTDRFVYACAHFFYDRAKRRYFEAQDRQDPMFYQASASNILIAANLFHRIGRDTFAENFLREFSLVISEAGALASQRGVEGLIFEEELDLVAMFAWAFPTNPSLKQALRQIEDASKHKVSEFKDYESYLYDYGHHKIPKLPIPQSSPQS